MAENKKSFILYVDLIHTVSKLPDDVSGKLFKLILSYVNDENPIDPTDLVLQIAFEPIKQQLKRDLKDWESERLARSMAGKKGMANRWHNKDNTDNSVITKDNSVIRPITNITDNVNVTDNVNDIKKEKRKKKLNPSEIENEIKDINNTELRENFRKLFLTPKWISKNISTIQATIKKSKKYEDKFMIDLVEKAIIGEYQGLFFSNTDIEYKKYLNSKNTNTQFLQQISNDYKPPKLNKDDL